MDTTHSLILTVVRHGQTQGNVNSITEGITDTPLNENGTKQAKAAGEWLKNENYSSLTANYQLKSHLHFPLPRWRLECISFFTEAEDS